MSPQHTLNALRGEGRTVLMLTGEVDTANADDVAGVVREELALGPVLIDLSELSFMDSSGLRMLGELVREAKEADQSLMIANDLSPMVGRLLEMTGMLALLPIEGRPAPD